MDSERIKLWRMRPDVFVAEVIGVIPDAWQMQVLQALPHNRRICMRACKGPGKTAVLAWIGWWALTCYPQMQIACTSSTKDLLEKSLWAEFALWQSKSPFLQEFFVWQKTRIFCKEDPELWFAAHQTWSKSADAAMQAQSMKGLHADNMMALMDETGEYPSEVMGSAEAMMSTVKNGWIIQAGNPSKLEGPLYDAATRHASKWWSVSVSSAPNDPNRTPRVNKQWAQDQIDMWGEDNPFIRTSIFGEFPPASINALLGVNDIDVAMGRSYNSMTNPNPVQVLGVDVARMGGDTSVVCHRDGLIVAGFQQFRNIDGLAGAGYVNQKWHDVKANACFVDDTGGFGASWIDQLKVLGRSPIPINFSANAQDGSHYFNKRAEMHFNCANAIKQNLQLPNDGELREEILATTYTFKGNKLIIEPKELIKKKLGGRSPDKFDALALTFAMPVFAPQAGYGGMNGAVIRLRNESSNPFLNYN